MFISDITVSKKGDRAAMYTILINLKDEADAVELAGRLGEELQTDGVRMGLFVWRPSDSPTVVDAYTFEKRTAEQALKFLEGIAAEYMIRAA
ncbi:MAG: hypothetical protein ACI9W4_002633 [Rhodothermales bacterium]|jgi:hypothetical protein